MRRPRTAQTIAALSIAFGLAGCAHMANDATVCPEYRSLRCATAPECSMDRARGCRVCTCSAASSGDRGERMPNPIPPDLRGPERR